MILEHFTMKDSFGRNIDYMRISITDRCNLRCKYCFASTGDFGTGRKIMDFETAKRAIDWVVAKSGNGATSRWTSSAVSLSWPWTP